jgi:hypothetical protein
MAITNENFDQQKIEKLKYFLEDMAEKNSPRPYEIFVDNLKVVPKTEDPAHFDGHEYYINEDTEKIRILIYNSVLSPRNDQYCFYIKPLPQQQPQSLNGPGDINQMIELRLSEREREYENRRMSEELQETKKQLSEAEHYIEGLEKKLEQATDAKYKFKNIDLLDLGAAMLGRLAEKHAGALTGLGLPSLSGMEEQSLPAPEAEASFQKKSAGLNEMQVGYLNLLQQLENCFQPEELQVVMEIIQRFVSEPQQLKKVAEMLQIPS